MPGPTKDELVQMLQESKAREKDAVEREKETASQLDDFKAVLHDYKAELHDRDACVAALEEQLRSIKPEAPKLEVGPNERLIHEMKMMFQDTMKHLTEQNKTQQHQIDDLKTQLTNVEKSKGPSSGPKPVAPPKLQPDFTIAKLKSWRKAWEDYAQMCKLSEMPHERQVATLRGTFSLQMRNIMDEVIGVDDADSPDELLAKIEGYIRKKRSVMLDMVEFDNRKQKASEDFDSYLVAVKQLADDADLVADHCDRCKVNCLDRRMAARLISGVHDEETRTKLLEEDKFPTQTNVIEICRSRESARRSATEHRRQSEKDINAVFKTYPRNRNRSQSRGRQPRP